jgi:hypothetical protein
MTQNQESLSHAQVEDGFGTYTDAAQQAGLEVIPDHALVPSTDFTEVAMRVAPDEIGPLGAPPTIEVARSRETYGTLGQYPGLRVLVGQRLPARDGSVKEVLLPGIVLPTKAPTGYANIGCLTAPNDIVFFPEKDAGRPLSDVQHALLQQTYAMHSEGVGMHTSNGQLNPVDVAHAAVIVTTDPANPRGLHNLTHEMVNTGLASSLTQRGSLDIGVGHDIRIVREGVIGIDQATRVVVAREHQLPTGELAQLSLVHGVGAAAIGLTLAATASRNDLATRNLSRNLDVMRQEMAT